MTKVITNITDQKNGKISGFNASDFTLKDNDINVFQDGLKRYSITLRLRPQPSQTTLPTTLPELENTKVNVTWTENKEETTAAWGTAKVDKADNSILITGLTLKGAFQFQFYGTFAFKNLEFTGKAGVSSGVSGKRLYAYLKVKKETPITSLISEFSDGMLSKDDKYIQPPDVFEGNPLQSMSFYIEYGAGGISKEFVLKMETELKINNTTFDLTLAYEYYASDFDEPKDPNVPEKTPQKTTRSGFTGILKVGAHRFSLKFFSAGQGSNKASYFIASYNYSAGINLKTLFAPFFEQTTDPNDTRNFIPDITIKDLQAFIVYSKKGTESRFLLGVGAGLGDTFSLANLPLAGKILKEDQSFAINKVLVMVSKGQFNGTDFGNLGSSINLPVLGKDTNLGKPDGFAFHLSLDLTIGPNKRNYFFSPGTDQLKKDADNRTNQPQQPGTVPGTSPPAKVISMPGTVSSSAKWIEVQKKLGPVDLLRVGFGFVEGNIIILLDASLTIAALGVQLRGFGLGFKPKWPPKVTAFYLDGIGISFKKDPIELSGAFMRGVQDEMGIDNKPTGNKVTVYTGAAILKLSKFTISGIGSYAKVTVKADKINPDTKQVVTGDKSYTSLFIYAVYDGPIGGPVFFLVTGIAAGFGMNRKVNVPSIDEVQDFPLVSLAMNTNRQKKKTLLDILADLQTPNKRTGKLPIEISKGDYWLAVGIKFSSFKIIDSFVLLIVSFGNRLRFDILGLSVLSLPPKLGEGLDPLVYVELALRISFGSDSDVIIVEARITPNSYVFGKDAKLRGGFALYIWVAGEHEGDFVVTLGGYHPRFKKPAHYPDVDRLSLNWKLSTFVSLRGEMYFALTPSAIMAGGLWEVKFDIGFLRASLLMWANMIISWAPFYYEIGIGVKVTIEANIKIGLILINFKLEMGAELRIWGPPFAGEAKVNWFIFSFTIPFGSADKGPKAIEWPEFSKTFVPQGEATPTEATKLSRKKSADFGSEQSDTPKIKTIANPIDIRIGSGIIQQIEAGEAEFILVNPYELAVGVDSFIPSSKLEYANEELAKTTKMEIAGDIIPSTYAKKYEGKLGIKPMRVTEMESSLKISITRKDSGLVSKEEIEIKGMAKGVPHALWSPYKPEPKPKKKKKKTGDKPVPESKVIKGVLTGIEFRPKREEGSSEKPFQFKPVERNKNLGLIYPKMDPAMGDRWADAIEPIKKGIGGKRDQIIDIAKYLNEKGFDVLNPSEIKLTGIEENANNLFYDQPCLANLGRKIFAKRELK